jgi:hypothetical protein
MRLSKEQKAEKVLEWLEVGPQTMDQLVTLSGMRRGAVRQGIDWLRDYDPNCIVTLREGAIYLYKLAEEAEEVRTHIHGRAKTLYKMALRLERMITIAVVKWPESKMLRIMALHLTRMREEVELTRED